MGVKFGREYRDIVHDLGEAIRRIDAFYDFFEMSEQDWNGLDDDEQNECVKTLADDVFYALGRDRELNVGTGHVHYIRSKHIIKVEDGNNVVTVVNLV